MIAPARFGRQVGAVDDLAEVGVVGGGPPARTPDRPCPPRATASRSPPDRRRYPPPTRVAPVMLGSHDAATHGDVAGRSSSGCPWRRRSRRRARTSASGRSNTPRALVTTTSDVRNSSKRRVSTPAAVMWIHSSRSASGHASRTALEKKSQQQKLSCSADSICEAVGCAVTELHVQVVETWRTVGRVLAQDRDNRSCSRHESEARTKPYDCQQSPCGRRGIPQTGAMGHAPPLEQSGSVSSYRSTSRWTESCGGGCPMTSACTSPACPSRRCPRRSRWRCTYPTLRLSPRVRRRPRGFAVGDGIRLHVGKLHRRPRRVKPRWCPP